MKSLIKRALKKQHTFNWTLVDASTEQPGKYLGTVISTHYTRSEILICQMDIEEGDPNARIRVFKLKNRVAPGTLVTPDDLEPIRDRDQTQ
jgi:hypothetical protein